MTPTSHLLACSLLVPDLMGEIQESAWGRDLMEEMRNLTDGKEGRIRELFYSTMDILGGTDADKPVADRLAALRNRHKSLGGGG